MPVSQGQSGVRCPSIQDKAGYGARVYRTKQGTVPVSPGQSGVRCLYLQDKAGYGACIYRTKRGTVPVSTGQSGVEKEAGEKMKHGKEEAGLQKWLSE